MGDVQVENKDSGLPIIGNDKFGLTEEHVADILAARQRDLEQTRNVLNHPDENVRSVAKDHIPIVEKEVRALSQPPDQVLARVKHFYDRTVELAETGMDQESLSKQLAKEFTDILDYYPLLRMEKWGYRLGQDVMSTMITMKHNQPHNEQ